jgi:hypothetical protein
MACAETVQAILDILVESEISLRPSLLAAPQKGKLRRYDIGVLGRRYESLSDKRLSPARGAFSVSSLLAAIDDFLDSACASKAGRHLIA